MKFKIGILDNKQHNLNKKSILNFFKKSTFIWGPKDNDIGVSVGHKNIIVIELDKSEDIPRVVRFAVRELTDENSNPALILKDMFQTEKFSNSFVHTSLSGKSVIVRFIKFQRMNKKELRSALVFEAEKYIPFDVDQVFLDFDVLSVVEDQKYLDIALVVAKKEAVEDFLKQMDEAGLTVKTIDVDTFACYNSFLAAYPDEQKKNSSLT